MPLLIEAPGLPDAANSNSLSTLDNSANALHVEVCAGTARLTSAIQRWGVPTLAIDYDRNRHISSVPILKIDLTDSEQSAIILEPVELGIVSVMSFAPPCGTASRARDIPMSGHNHGPSPLRSESCPWGLPDLSHSDKQRVELANCVYRTIYMLVMSMLQQGKSVIIENPIRSWLWELPPYKNLLALGLFDVCLQNCKYSIGTPSRPKWTRFRTNIPEFKLLGGPCKLKHEHLPWGIKTDGTFATADEAAYPIPL